jgi:hypothetical protein
MTAALAGRRYDEDLSRAQGAIAEFRASDHDPIASVVRRPLHRMVEDLGAFAPTAA